MNLAMLYKNSPLHILILLVWRIQKTRLCNNSDYTNLQILQDVFLNWKYISCLHIIDLNQSIPEEQIFCDGSWTKLVKWNIVFIMKADQSQNSIFEAIIALTLDSV